MPRARQGDRDPGWQTAAGSRPRFQPCRREAGCGQVRPIRTAIRAGDPSRPSQVLRHFKTGSRLRRHVLAVLHRSPDLRHRAVDRDHVGRRAGDVESALGPVPAGHAADGASQLHLSRRQRRGGGRDGGRAHRAAGQRRGADALHGVVVGQRRLLQSLGDLRAGDGPEPGPGVGAEPGEPGLADAPGRHQADRRDDAEAGARHPHVRQRRLAPRPLRPALPEQLRADVHPRRAAPPAGDQRHLHRRPARLQHADLGRSGQARRAEPHGRRRGGRACGSRTRRWPAGRSAGSRCRGGRRRRSP